MTALWKWSLHLWADDFSNIFGLVLKFFSMAALCIRVKIKNLPPLWLRSLMLDFFSIHLLSFFFFRSSFPFCSTFGLESSQEDVFEEIRPLVQSAIDGFNITTMAYGQTGMIMMILYFFSFCTFLEGNFFLIWYNLYSI